MLGLTFSKKKLIASEAAYEIFRQMEQKEFQEGNLIIMCEKALLFFELVPKNQEIDLENEAEIKFKKIIKKFETRNVYEVVATKKGVNLDTIYTTPVGNEREVESRFYRLATEEEILCHKMKTIFA